MRPTIPTWSRLLTRVTIAAMLATSVLLVGPSRAPVAQASHGPQFPLCVDKLATLRVTAYGTPGQSEAYTVSSDPGDTIAFSATIDGTFTPTLEVQITYGSGGSGQSPTFYMKGMATGIAMVVAASTTQQTHLDVVVDRIIGIALKNNDDQALEADPKDPTAGDDVRIFPDVSAPGTDVTPFRRVKAIASTELDTPNLQVEFRAWDMDDPSNDPVVDPNGEAGVDNLGTGATIGYVATTNAAGKATSILNVSQQPGDNFRVTATCGTGLHVGLAAIGPNVLKANGDPRPPEVKQSDHLTVWRHLNIESDSMGQVRGNELSGVVSRAANATLRRRGSTPFAGIKVVLPRSVIDSAGDTVDFGLLDTDEFRDGEIKIGGVAYPVRYSEGSTVWLDPGPDPRTFRGLAFTLVDDDKLGGALHDDGTEVPQPDLAFLSESDTQATNWFADVYIRPVHLAGSEGSLPFRINVDEPGDAYCRVLTAPCPAGSGSFDGASAQGNPSFWVVYLLGAYQGPLATDGDPDIPAGAAGAVTLERADLQGHGAAVFFESVRDEAGAAFGDSCSAAGVAVHGLGHLFTGSGHVAGDTGVMAASCIDGSGTWSPANQRAIRMMSAP